MLLRITLFEFKIQECSQSQELTKNHNSYIKGQQLIMKNPNSKI